MSVSVEKPADDRDEVPQGGGGIVGILKRLPAPSHRGEPARAGRGDVGPDGAHAAQHAVLPYRPDPDDLRHRGWQGASPEDVSTAILDVIEPEVRFPRRVDNITSYAVEGSARIVVEFVEGADMDKALSDVEQALGRRHHPAARGRATGRHPRRVLRDGGAAGAPGAVSEDALKAVAREARDGLLDRGIDRVTFTGSRTRELWVEVDPLAMRRLGLTARDVSNAIADANQSEPLGTLEARASARCGRFRAPTAPPGSATIEVVTTPEGERVFVRDVAEVREALRDGRRAPAAQRRADDPARHPARRERRHASRACPRPSTTWRSCRRACRPPSRRSSSTCARRWSRSASRRCRSTRSRAWRSSVVVLLFFLNTRVAFWVAMGIPISLFATFALMWATGQTINAISLLGLILVLGILVDDAIIVGEHAVTLSEEGKSPTQAAHGAAMRMLVPVHRGDDDDPGGVPAGGVMIRASSGRSSWRSRSWWSWRSRPRCSRASSCCRPTCRHALAAQERRQGAGRPAGAPLGDGAHARRASSAASTASRNGPVRALWRSSPSPWRYTTDRPRRRGADPVGGADRGRARAVHLRPDPGAGIRHREVEVRAGPVGSADESTRWWQIEQSFEAADARIFDETGRAGG